MNTAPMLSLVPPPMPIEPPPPLTGKPLEDAARAELCKMLHLDVSVSAPTWRQVLFSGKRIKFEVPKAPAATLTALSQIKPPDSLTRDHVGITALGLAENLQKAKPEGMVPRSITAMPALPVSRDSMTSWMRRLFLVTAGPECAALLVSAGYLLPSDMETLEAAYPEGMDDQRKQAVEAGMAVTSAGHRNGVTPELPGWLNDQLMTLMDEDNSPDVQGVYDQSSPEVHGGGGAPGGKAGKISQQAAPDTIKGTL